MRDGQRAIAELTGLRLDEALLEPLGETLAFWETSASRRRPTLGPAGVLLSVRFVDDRPTAIRCDTEPPWQLDDPLLVHRILERLAAAAGVTAQLPALRAPLRWAAWPPPGTGPGPYLGVGCAADAAATVRSWGPATGPRRRIADLFSGTGLEVQPGDDLPLVLARRLRLLFTGIEVGPSGLAKLGVYLAGDPAADRERVLILAGRLGAPHPERLRSLVRMAAIDPHGYVGLALRRGSQVAEWEPVVEVGTRGCAVAEVAAWVRRAGHPAAAEVTAALAGCGLGVTTVAVGARSLAFYAAPSAPPAAPGRRVHVRQWLTAGIGEPDRAGALAQSIIDWRGEVHTVSWSPGTPPRWQTIAAAPRPGTEAEP